MDHDPFAGAAIKAAYDTVAADYDAAFGQDLDRLPLDRSMLDAAAARLDGSIVVDLGCGTGSAGHYLAARGANVVGVDLSRRMLERAAGRPGLHPVQADLQELPLPARSVDLAVAFYSLHHLARRAVPEALAEVRRVLSVRGTLLLATHLGEGEVATADFLGHHVRTFGATFWAAPELIDVLTGAGFSVLEATEREPLEHEYPSRRLYVLARARGRPELPT